MRQLWCRITEPKVELTAVKGAHVTGVLNCCYLTEEALLGIEKFFKHHEAQNLERESHRRRQRLPQVQRWGPNVLLTHRQASWDTVKGGIMQRGKERRHSDDTKHHRVRGDGVKAKPNLLCKPSVRTNISQKELDHKLHFKSIIDC